MIHHRVSDSLLSTNDVAYIFNISGDCGHLISKYKKPCYYKNLTFSNKVGHGKLCDDCEEVYKVADDVEQIPCVLYTTALFEEGSMSNRGIENKPTQVNNRTRETYSLAE